MGVAFGFEHRIEKLDLADRPAFTTGDLAGQGGPTIGVGGQYSVKELFAEFRVPLIEKAALRRAPERERQLPLLRLQHRRDQTDTYGLGLEWAPVKSVKLPRQLPAGGARAQRDRAVHRAGHRPVRQRRGSLRRRHPDRAPWPSARAPASRRPSTARILDSPAGQYNYLHRRQPEPEARDGEDSTLGVVLHADAGPDISFDYFNIKVEDVIGNVGRRPRWTKCLRHRHPRSAT